MDEATAAFAALLNQKGIRGYPRNWACLKLALDETPPDHELRLWLDSDLIRSRTPTPRTLKQALEVWTPRLVYMAPAITRRDHNAIKPTDRERLARWLWWNALHNAEMIADPPPASWAEVALTSEEASVG